MRTRARNVLHAIRNSPHWPLVPLRVLELLLICALVSAVLGCSSTLPVSPTLPPLPPELKRQPIPFPDPPGLVKRS